MSALLWRGIIQRRMHGLANSIYIYTQTMVQNTRRTSLARK